MKKLVTQGPRVGSNRPSFAAEPLEGRRLLAAAVDATVASLEPALVAGPTRLVEDLDRGVIAMNQGNGRVYVGWRMLGLDSQSIGFNLYRQVGTGSPVKVNASPLTRTTDYVDTGVNTSAGVTYSVRPVLNGVEGDVEGSYQLAPGTRAQPYHAIPLQRPADVVNPFTNQLVTYSANDTSVGDLDGDGQYEIVVKWDPSDSGDNNAGYRSNVYVDAYEFDGTRLWRIDMGRNIRAGSHYTQIQVWDLDSDGSAEVAVRTAPGTIDGQGKPVLLGSDRVDADYRNGSGYILTGPEYLTVFDGQTGGELDTVPFEPARGNVSEWGDNYGNRVDRFLAGTAYLDGRNPSLIFSRGYYGPQSGYQSRNEVAAYDFRDGELSVRWIFKASTNGPNREYIGQGAHSLTIGDVDQDGFDEIVYGASVIDHDGTGLYSTGLGHGDALHMSDMDPTRPGQEIFMVHEDPNAHQGRGGTLRDAATGEILAVVPGSGDVGRGVAMDIDPNHLGYEMWSTGDSRMFNAVTGEPIYDKGNAFVNFGVWWDADLSRELLDRTTISDWLNPGRRNFDLDPNSSSYYPPNVDSNNGTKATPALSGDILGDWREEVIWRTVDSSALHVYSTNIPANNRMYTLMHDTQYREAIAWQNSGYNQPPHPSFYLGTGMAAAPTPNIEYVENDGFTPDGSGQINVYQAEDARVGGVFLDSNNPGYNGTGFANFDTGGSFVDFDIDAGNGGQIDVFVRYALGATAARTGALVVNGVRQNVTFEPTGSWATWVERRFTLDLNPGQNSVRFESTGQDLANLDQLRVDIELLPAPWTTGYFGAAPGGSVAYDDGTFDLVGSGADIWGTADAFRYVYQPVSGDVSIVARVDGPLGTDPWAKAGLMVRGGLDENAANAAVFLTRGNGVSMQRRAVEEGTSDFLLGPAFSGPLYLRLDREGDVFTSYTSADGAAWSEVGSYTVDLPELAYIGMAVTSHNAAEFASASFADVSVGDVPVAAPEAQITSMLVNDGGVQRSMVRSLTVTFDHLVTPTSGAFRLTRDGAGDVQLSSTNPSGDGTTWLLTPTGAGVSGGSLVNGLYTLSVDPSRIDGAAAGSVRTMAFHRLYADVNGDRRVNFVDLAAFRRTLGTSAGDSLFDDAFDVNSDGSVNFVDLASFRRALGTSL